MCKRANHNFDVTSILILFLNEMLFFRITTQNIYEATIKYVREKNITIKCANDKIYYYKMEIIELLEIKLHSFIRINIFKDMYPLQYCFKTFLFRIYKINNKLVY